MSENETPKSHLVTQNDTRTTLQFARAALGQARESRATLTPSAQRVRSSLTGNLDGNVVSSSLSLDSPIAKFIGWPVESPEFASLTTTYLQEVIPAFGDWSKATMEEYLTILEDVSAFMRDDAGIGNLSKVQTESEVEEITQQFLVYYNRFVDWTRRVMKAPVDLPTINIRNAMVRTGMAALEDIETFLTDMIKQVDAVSILSPDQRSTVRVRLSFRGVDSKLDDEVKLLTEEIKEVKDLISRIATEREARQSLAGFLYLLINPSMGDLVKVGKTKRNPKDRARELGAVTGIPTPFILVFDCAVDDCDQAERYVHERLAEFRVSSTDA